MSRKTATHWLHTRDTRGIFSQCVAVVRDTPPHTHTNLTQIAHTLTQLVHKGRKTQQNDCTRIHTSSSTIYLADQCSKQLHDTHTDIHTRKHTGLYPDTQRYQQNRNEDDDERVTSQPNVRKNQWGSQVDRYSFFLLGRWAL